MTPDDIASLLPKDIGARLRANPQMARTQKRQEPAGFVVPSRSISRRRAGKYTLRRK